MGYSTFLKFSFLLFICCTSLLILLMGCSASSHSPSSNGSNDDSTIIGDMVNIPGGEFRMGSPPNMFNANERPIHTVWLDGYYMNLYEVTNAEYASFLCDSTGGLEHWYFGMEIVREDDRFRAAVGKDDYPVRFVKWEDAAAYAEWLGGRLPTEAEWEKAARGPNDERIFPWGFHIYLGQANFSNQSGGIWKVGTATGKSYYGCWDMAGNVWEWTADWYDEHYYSASPYRNPPGAAAGEEKTVRGGAYHNNEFYVRCAIRWPLDPNMRYGEVGFRCVVDSADYQGD